MTACFTRSVPTWQKWASKGNWFRWCPDMTALPSDTRCYGVHCQCAFSVWVCWSDTSERWRNDGRVEARSSASPADRRTSIPVRVSGDWSHRKHLQSTGEVRLGGTSGCIGAGTAWRTRQGARRWSHPSPSVAGATARPRTAASASVQASSTLRDQTLVSFFDTFHVTFAPSDLLLHWLTRMQMQNWSVLRCESENRKFYATATCHSYLQNFSGNVSWLVVHGRTIRSRSTTGLQNYPSKCCCIFGPRIRIMNRSGPKS